jgi:hypothetical protein
VKGAIRVAGTEQLCPFLFENVHHTSIECGSIARSERHNTEAIFSVIGCKESQLLLVTMMDGDLMVYRFVVESNKIYPPCRVTEIVNIIVTARDRVFKRQSDLIEATVGDAHAPNEVQNIEDMFLMRFCGEDNRRASRSITFANPIVVEKNLHMTHNYFAFVRSIMIFFTANGSGTTGVNSKLKIKDRKFDTCRIEAIPMRLDEISDGRSHRWGDVGPYIETLGKLSKVASTVPQMDVGTRVRKRLGGPTNGFAVALEYKYTLVDVVAIVHWDVSINWLGSPKLGWHVDNKCAGSMRPSSRKR